MLMTFYTQWLVEAWSYSMIKVLSFLTLGGQIDAKSAKFTILIFPKEHLIYVATASNHNFSVFFFLPFLRTQGPGPLKLEHFLAYGKFCFVAVCLLYS